MAEFLAAFGGQLKAIWMPSYLPLMVAALVLAFGLRRSARGTLAFALQALFFFVVLILASAFAGVVQGEHAYSGPLAEMAVLVLGVLLIRLVAVGFFRLVMPRLGLHPPRILEELLILVAYCAWLLLRLSMTGVDLGSLVASTAVLTAVLAFAMQDTLGNILSGLALQLDHSVHIGDWVELEDVSGEVIQVQWRHTAIKTLKGEIVIIPNSQLMKLRIKLIGGPSVPYRLRVVQFYANYQPRPSLVIKRISDSLATAQLRGVSLHDAPYCRIAGFQHGQVVYSVIYWLSDPESPGSTDGRVLHHVYTEFERNGWQMGAPAHDVLLGSAATRATQQDRRLQSEVQHRVRTLRQQALFSPLTSEELRQLALSLKTSLYLKGTLLTRQGQVGEHLFIVVSGEVDVWLEMDGQRHSLAVVGEGHVLGEMSLLTGEARRATLTARTDVECYLLEKEAFEAIVHQRPELAEALAALLAERNKELVELQDNVKDQPAVFEQEKAAILNRIRSFLGL